MSAPVLLIIYKRPEHTRRALRAILTASPSKVFIAADGPKGSGDERACADARAVVDEFSFECPVETSFSAVNLGCGVRVYTAIDWAFTMTEELVIVEDDCVPNTSFFSFCHEVLNRFRDDERIMHVSGNNFVGAGAAGPYGYYFSKYPHASGWATWKRAWRHFDWRIAQWPELRQVGLVESWCSDPYEQRYWNSIFDRMHGGDRDVWDLMWMFACWSQSGLAVLPAVNLVVNEGYGGPDATHTHAAMDWPASQPLREINHPPQVLRNIPAERWTFDHNFGGAEMRAKDRPAARFRRQVAPLLWPLRAAKRLLRRAVPRLLQ